jgi:biotin carboxylase
MSTHEEAEYKRSITAVLRQAGVRLGDFDDEGFFTPEGRFFIIEINPRQAGHYTPQDAQLFCGVNFTKLLITTAAGDMSYYEELRHFPRERNYMLSHSVFSEKDGIFDHIHIDPSLRSKMKSYRLLHGQKEGDFVRNIRDAVRPIAVMVFVFETQAELEQAREHITELVYPVVSAG